jgi:serine/threonine protein phosphatase 1
MDPIDFTRARGPDGILVYAIGDVHGRLDLLGAMHERIADDIGARGGDWRIVHLGDYVDRGPESRGVLDFLARRVAEDERVVALAGNHDQGFLDFLARPEPDGLFALYGGVETAASYGVALDLDDPDAFRAACARLDAAVPRAHRDFLASLPLSASFGDFFFCHAGIRPGVSLDLQDPYDLVWIRGDFHRHQELHPKVIVHGHTPVRHAEILPNRVNLDTGAFASNRLTALVVDGAEKRLLTVEL